MKNPTLIAIGKVAVKLLGHEYGSAAVMEGDNLMIVNAFPEGATIEVKITITPDEPEPIKPKDDTNKFVSKEASL